MCSSLLLITAFPGNAYSPPPPHSHTFSRLSLLVFSGITLRLGTLPVKVQVLSLLHVGYINSELFIRP